ncbi:MULTISPECIES: DUF4845 domain-containing protein [unclassified Oceanobacter]|jgi:hypothetical protein|uniref:DUF4845 domain-containing protein n=1 Tax=unclassified Oceanobacter TaxID=2620260 RepID=UPI0026E3728A|nr:MULTISPECIES: DUF4845 domain-containing protein [unclassified Oceanobacter]MDO6682585.1 DUF4845 domain-containing protein [Oceanobacter sp. 5_MG-2023]MDP2506801.1 DUF4845 domain-containing protein [Oceanobacter sp. 3_MG-2023]MDP2547890.1 DUF4845 domain-containing protein [Oceanobacter sp. 4_MG-2023]MDP2608818.1 DUF4845 domain-containing protein [Oceanobacter sp. 1_MG-2023]MDP2611940.1 DUF4845 domain-containing protein [Oceanobacter sp. 2_MG-2023]
MKKQAGMSFYSVIMVLVMVGVLAKAAIAVMPMYWDDRMLQQVLDTLHSSKTITATTSVKEVHKVMAARISSNNLNITIDDMVVMRTKGAVTIDWTYEVKEHFMGNLYVIGQFTHHEEFQ